MHEALQIPAERKNEARQKGKTKPGREEKRSPAERKNEELEGLKGEISTCTGYLVIEMDTGELHIVHINQR